MSKNQILQTLQKTPPMQIASLDFVREKFVENYNKCNASDSGELMYHRQLVHFNQQISGSDQLKKADPFSLYACFVTAAVNGYSFDPEDDEIYLLSIKGKAHLWRQAGAHVRRLQRTRQIKFAEQARIVYQGDTFQVENGRVVRHVENFQSETMIAAYVRFVIDDAGADRFFIYRKSDWESWRKKSSNKNTIQKSGHNGTYLSESLWDNGVIGGENPEPGFLRTKIIKHACKENCWAIGNSIPAEVETFTEIEIDADHDELEQIQAAPAKQDNSYSEFEEVEETTTEDPAPSNADEDAF